MSSKVKVIAAVPKAYEGKAVYGGALSVHAIFQRRAQSLYDKGYQLVAFSAVCATEADHLYGVFTKDAV
ncbi:MAG: hypothetical protein E3J42_04140 [Dehalococcoidia bacterium]|nr:MAG: hypothetical protein E3J42_04140 [Dehalococcoidia bacterium]